MSRIGTTEYKALRELRVAENEGGPVAETLASSCLVFLISALCSMVSCYFWPATVGAKRPLRRRLILESAMLIIPMQLLLSSGAPFLERFDVRGYNKEYNTTSMKAEYSHSLLLVPCLLKAWGWVGGEVAWEAVASMLGARSVPATQGQVQPHFFTYELLLWVVLGIVITGTFVRRRRRGAHPPTADASSDVGQANAWKQDFTVYRGTLTLLTCMGILAIDFNFFPSRFMKTEAYGISTMDIGVASFMISGGIGSAPKATEMEALLVQWICWLLGMQVPRSISSLASLDSPAIGLARFLRTTKIAKQLAKQELEERERRTSNAEASSSSSMPSEDALLDILAPAQQLQQIHEGIRSAGASLSGQPQLSQSTSVSVDCEAQRRSLDLLRKFLFPSLPLFLLGLLRTGAVHAFDHPQHVTEYGVHWNFFFTLAMLPFVYLLVLVATITVSLVWGATIGKRLLAIGNIHPDLCSIAHFLAHVPEKHYFKTTVAILVHQSLLSLTSMSDFVLSSDREGLLKANKEGMLTLIGFTSLYSAGIDVGNMLRTATSNAARRRGLMLGCALALVAFGIVDIFVQRASRRLCNASFIAFAVAFNLLGGICLSCVPYTFDGLRPASVVLEAINRNQLFIFLVSNLLVGLLNQASQTIFVSNPVAHAILACYSLYGCVLAWKLKRLGLVIR